MHCVACSIDLLMPLTTFGDIDAPMCQSCYLDLLTTPDPYDEPYFTYEDIGDGWQVKRLTKTGAIVLGGSAGDAIFRINREQHCIVIPYDAPLAS